MKLKKKAITLKEAANFLNIEYKGDPNLLITGINEIHKVDSGDLTFVDIEKYYSKALNSKATTIIINKEVDVPKQKALLISNDPFRDYNKLVKKYKKTQSLANQKYTVGDNVKIGLNTRIFPGVVIMDNVKIGDNCNIFPNVVIYEDTQIGNNVTIHASTVIGADAFYFKNYGTHFEKMISCGKVIIEDNVEIGASCTIDKGVSGITRIGKGSILDNLIHIGHGVVMGERCLLAGQVGIGGKTIVEDEVIMWGQAGITKDVTIGRKAIISGNAGVSKSLKGGKLYFGSPAEEANKMYRQLAATRMLPNIIKNIKKTEK